MDYKNFIMNEATTPVDWVDPLIDTANRRFFFFTTASRPFGMVNLSPDTRVGGDAWSTGYRYTDNHIHWFSHVHAWQLCGLPVMPITGSLKADQGSDIYKSSFSHKQEITEPGYYSVYLQDYAINAELTSTVRTGFHRYTFKEAGEAWIILDLGADISSPMSDCFVRRTDDCALSGFIENERTRRRRKRVKIFYYAQFDREPEQVVYWQNDGINGLEGGVAGPGTGAAVKFNVKEGETILLKVALSYCSTKQALLNLNTELPHWDFDKTHSDARQEWNRWLSRIEVNGGTEAQKTKFYTDLFHSIKGRRRVSDVNGKYLDMTGDLPKIRQIPLDETGYPKYDHHNSDAFWGSPWSLNILWALVWPEVTSSFCNTLTDYYKNGGLIPRGPSGGDYTFVMTSPTSTTFLVSAWIQGITNFDIDSAYEGMLKNHQADGLMSKAGYEHYTSVGGGCEYYLTRGYVPEGIKAHALHLNGAAKTLEYAYHDWALAQLAEKMGRKEDYNHLMQRAHNYKNIWDSKTLFFRPRNKDGEFLPDFDPMSPSGWTEGNAHHYRWHVPHDIDGLMELFGGREKFISELNSLFEEAEAENFVAGNGKHQNALLDYGNQPCTYIAHLFNYAGAPWLTQKWVHKIRTAAKSDITPFGGYGGDEDQGLMGSLNALMAIGLFNVQGGCNKNPFYEITAPVFERIKIHLNPAYHDGGTIVIETENNNPENIFIQSVELNGKTWTKPWISHQDLTGGGHLKIVLGPQPNKEWGAKKQDAMPF